MASLKLCLQTGQRSQIRRSRIDSLPDFTFSALQKIANDIFPGLSGEHEYGYEDEDGELVTLLTDDDVAECVKVMDVAGKKTLRIEIITSEWKPKAKAEVAQGVWRARGPIRAPLLTAMRGPGVVRPQRPRAPRRAPIPSC